MKLQPDQDVAVQVARDLLDIGRAPVFGSSREKARQIKEKRKEIFERLCVFTEKEQGIDSYAKKFLWIMANLPTVDLGGYDFDGLERKFTIHRIDFRRRMMGMEDEEGWFEDDTTTIPEFHPA